METIFLENMDGELINLHYVKRIRIKKPNLHWLDTDTELTKRSLKDISKSYDIVFDMIDNSEMVWGFWKDEKATLDIINLEFSGIKQLIKGIIIR